MTRTRSAFLLATLMTCSSAFAQQPADAMERLAPYEGTYTLDGFAQIEDGTFDGTLTVAPILGGHFQQWDWTLTMRGEGIEEDVYLRFVVSHDAATGSYAVHRFDSRDADSPTRAASITDPHRGTLSFDGDALVMSWPSSNPNNPAQTGHLRNTVRLDADGFTVTTDAKPDDGSPRVAIATTNASRR
ncbi:MAG: hypothetical protein AAFV01_14375 [Bacteroidota bacterium]